jgi:hypothetical protein
MSASDPTATKPTNPVCLIVRASFEPYRRDTLPAPQRRMLREHLLACEGCRDAAAAEDPTLRFARPLHERVSEGETREILSAVMTGVDLLKTERRIRMGSARPSRRLRIGSAAAASVAAVAAAVLLSSGSGILQTPAMPVGAVGARAAAPASPASASVSPQASVSSAPASTTALQPAAMAGADPAPSSDATVYDWNPGAGREEPRVVWIVDRGLDI